MTVNDYGKIIVHKLEFPNYSSYDGRNPNLKNSNSNNHNKQKENIVKFNELLSSEIRKLDENEK